MKHTNEQFDQLLEAHVDGERIDPVFKSALIDSLENTMKKKTALWTRILIPSLLSMASVVTVIAATTDVRLDFWNAVVDSPPNPVASNWEKEHVSFAAAPGFALPQPLTIYELEHLEVIRKNTDPIAEQLNPLFLSNAVKETKHTIVYTAGDQELVFYTQDDQSASMSYRLMGEPNRQQFDADNRRRIREAEQGVTPEYDVTAFNEIIAALPTVSGEHTVLQGRKTNSSDDLLQRVQFNETFSFDEHAMRFINGQPFQFSSQLVTGVTETAFDYGSTEEVIAFLQNNPRIPLNTLLPKDLPDVDVRYDIVDYTLEPGDVSPVKLTLHAQLVNPDQVNAALSAHTVELPREVEMEVPIPEERRSVDRDAAAQESDSE